MKKDKDRKSPTKAVNGYKNKDRDFQHTRKDIDNAPSLQRDATNENTKKANTPPKKSEL